MKRASLIVATVFFSAALFAQMRGGVVVGPTSSLPGRSAIPSSVPIGGVNSVGPSGFSYSSLCNNGGCATYFPQTGTILYPGQLPVFNPHHGNGHGGHGGHGNHTGHNGYYPGTAYYVPYAYPVAVPVEPDQPEAASDEAAPPADIPFDRPPVMGPAPYTQPAPQPAPAPADQNRHVNLSPVSEEKIPVVIVFKDGHQQEISNGNYAIVGDLLYDLSGPVAHKIKLADVDVAQTVQQNEQRGVEFSVPSSYKPQA